MPHSESTSTPVVDEVKEALERLVALVDKYGEGPNQEIRDAFDRARTVLGKVAAKEAAKGK